MGQVGAFRDRLCRPIHDNGRYVKLVATPASPLGETSVVARPYLLFETATRSSMPS
jgi:hypothetical protein